MFADLFFHWCYFGATLSLLMAFGQSLAPRHHPQRAVLALFMVGVAVIQFNLTYFLKHEKFIGYFLYYLQLPFLFLVGPLIYFYIVRLADVDFKWHQSSHSHLLPAIVVSIYSMVSYFGNKEADLAAIPRVFWLFSASGLMYYSWLIRQKLAHVWHPTRVARIELNHLQILAMLGLVCSGMVLIAAIFASETLFGLFTFAMTAMVIAMFLMTVRYPEYPIYLMEELHQNREGQRKNHLEQVNVKKLGANFDFFMTDEKIYRDRDLTLMTMAAKLDVSSRQLSEFLTRHRHTNFVDYLETARVEEAKALLVTEPDRGILEIGLHVGFRTSSAFYTAFRECTGMSPGQYREAPPDQLLLGRQGEGQKTTADTTAQDKEEPSSD